MAGASLLALLDDIATILDDVAVMTKVAAKKTAGVLGDDLALNAEQVSGVAAERELPVVWAVAKGSMLNKAILVPAALAISAFAPWAITPLLMVGGAFLCYEGFEKVAHRLLHSRAEDDAQHAQLARAVADPQVDLVALEKRKIKGAIRTDFILSAEIIVITLGTVAAASLPKQLAVLAGIAALMTVGVYGLVAGIVKLDDVGLHLHRADGDERPGAGATRAGPRDPRRSALPDEGSVDRRHRGDVPGRWRHPEPRRAAAAPRDRSAGAGLGAVAVIVPLLADALVGIAAGALVLAAVTGIKTLSARVVTALECSADPPMAEVFERSIASKSKSWEGRPLADEDRQHRAARAASVAAARRIELNRPGAHRNRIAADRPKLHA